MLLGYGAKVGLGNMRVKAENRMVTIYKDICEHLLIKFLLYYRKTIKVIHPTFVLFV